MASMGASRTSSQGSAHSMAFSSAGSSGSSTTPSSTTSIWSDYFHADDDGFLISSYRAGGPQLTSLPASRESLGPHYLQRAGLEDTEAAQRFQRLVLRLLGQFGIPQQPRISITGRISIVKPEKAPIPTLLIVFTDNLPMDSSQWRIAARALQFRFSDRLPEISVELIHEKLLRRARCHPVPRSHPIVPVWERICYEILTHCDIRPWSGLSCWRYGIEDAATANPVTVIVSLLERSRGPFTTSLQKIKWVLSRHHVDNVNVLFMKDEIATDVGGFDDHQLKRGTCSQDVQPGVSIGIHDSDAGSSSLGGLIELKLPRDPEWHVFALTCFHCVWPPAANRSDLPGIHQQGAQDALDNWEYEPVTPNNHRARQLLRVDQPSPSDMHARINHIEAEIDEIKSEKFRHVQQQIEADEFVIPRDESIYRQKSMEIKMLTNEQSIFQLFLDKGVLLGHVYAGSGVNRVCVGRRNTNQMFDWALVKISPDRLPEREDLARQNMPFTYLHSERMRFTGISPNPLDLDNPVVKSGKSTGFTRGYVNVIKGVRIAHIRNARGPGSRSVETFELQVTGKDQMDFAVPGDSGSFVTDLNGKVIGMLLGGTTRANASYVTPLADIFEDIKRVTRAEDVRLVL